MASCEGESVEYNECGLGPSIVLVPGSVSTAAAWRPVVARLGDHFRCITTSLLGYGGTAERRSVMDSDISHEAEALEEVIRRAACPVHLVGHSFGGLVSVAVALRKRVPLLSLSIIEAPAPGLLRYMGDHKHYHVFRRMTDAYLNAYQRGDLSAIATVVDFYGGVGTFASWPQRVRDHAVQMTTVNLLDWSAAYGFQPSGASLASITVPTLIVIGETSHPAVRHTNGLLGRCLLDATLETIAGASHFMLPTHPEQVAALIRRHVCRTEDRSAPLPGGITPTVNAVQCLDGESQH